MPETIPFIADRARADIRNEYVPAPDHKALAISSGPIGFITGQADDEAAKTAALDMCQKRADALPQPRQCELYAVGNTVVYDARASADAADAMGHARSVDRKAAGRQTKFRCCASKARRPSRRTYVPAPQPKALAIGPRAASSSVQSGKRRRSGAAGARTLRQQRRRSMHDRRRGQ